MTTFLVWSNQHGMWWRAGQRGYTPLIEEAGRYDRPIAEEIVAAATLDGALGRLTVDPVSGQSYQRQDEVMVLAPESIPDGAP